MKKLSAILIIPAFLVFVACNSAQKKTGNDQPDTGSKHGASGPTKPETSSASDTINGSAAPFAETTAGTDTSTDGFNTDNPLVDTAKPKPAKGNAKK
ncbi:hypothetical protein [Mucilaginibacter sp. dw_454]|uniref:hypothetical protein n=1 Tax=Mucilaginibacter sp. dw_454 TaxID=2720079 RepID=UPI001BD65FC2|nr:hypothetical protein [Mucilaginibacter sp. dw_454]